MTCAVYFNLDDTLTEFTRDFEEMYRDAIEEAGWDELADRYEKYTDLFFDHFNDGYAFPRRQAIEKLSKDRDCFDPEKVEDFAKAWDEIESDAVRLKDGTEDLLDDLEDEYSLGIISNGTGDLQQKKLDKTGIAEYFDTVIISGKVGYRKPEKAMVEYAKGQMEADTYVMVSNSLKRDLVPSRKAGFETVWVYDGDNEIPDRVRDQIHVVEDLDQAGEAVRAICG